MPVVFIPVAFREQEAKAVLAAVTAVVNGSPPGQINKDHPLVTAHTKLAQTIRAVCGDG